MMRKKIALFGCGKWGQNILSELSGLGAATDVFEINNETESVAMKLGASNFAKICENPAAYDGIIISTPSSTHRDLVQSLSEYGIPIFLEKPLTISKTDADALKQSDPQNIYLMHIWLYHPGIQRLAQIAKSEMLGKVLAIKSTRANWTSPRTDSDSAWNLLPHDLTITKAILGKIPEPRFAVSEYHNGVIRGMTAIMGNKPHCIFEVSNRYERKIREVRLHCKEGVAVLENEKVDYITIVRGNHASSLSTEREYFDSTPPLRLELKEFLRYLEGGPPPRSTFRDGLEVVNAIHQLRKMSE